MQLVDMLFDEIEDAKRGECRLLFRLELSSIMHIMQAVDVIRWLSMEQ